MKTLGIVAIVWLSLCAFALFILHIKSHRFVKSVFLNAILGFAAVAAINLTQKFTGVHIPLNYFTVSGSGIFGLPAVCATVLVQIIFQ